MAKSRRRRGSTGRPAGTDGIGATTPTSVPGPLAERPERHTVPPLSVSQLSDYDRSIGGVHPMAWVWLAVGLHVLALFLLVLVMTPLTYNLDDIKKLWFFNTGPILFLFALGLIVLRLAPPPPRWVGLGLAAYFALMVVSAAASRYSWIGWDMVIFMWCAIGYFMTAMCAGAHRTTSRFFMRYFVIQLFVLNVIGYFMFNFVGGEETSGVAVLFNWLYPEQVAPREPGLDRNIYSLLLTLSRADGVLQSTILNRDFYAATCLLYLPFAVAVAIDPHDPVSLVRPPEDRDGAAESGEPVDGEGTTLQEPAPGLGVGAMVMRGIAILTTILSLLSIFFCQSKGEYIFAFVSLVFFLLMLLLFVRIQTVRRRHLFAFLAGFGVLLFTAVWMQSPTLLQKLKDIDYSVESRSIIWAGSLGIFKEFPILGGGPGTFLIYFPQFRRSDYFEHEISNVTLYSHNYFLDLLCETGILGFGAFMVLLGALGYGAFRVIVTHKDPRVRLMMLACLTGLVGMFGSNLSSPNARWVIGGSSLWTVLGFTAGVLRQSGGWRPMTAPRRLADARNWLERFWAPENQWRWVLPGVPAAVGIIMFFVSSTAGVNYFRGAVAYAEGLRNMQPVYDDISGPNRIPPAQAHELLSRAAGYFGQALEHNPGLISGYYKLASTWMTLYQFSSREAQQAIRKGDTETAMDAQERSDLYLRRAKEEYEELTEMAPDYAEIHYNLGIVYNEWSLLLKRDARRGDGMEDVEESDPDEYVRLARKHLEIMNEMSIKKEVFVLRAQQLQMMDDNETARDVYREALKYYPLDEDLARNYYRTAQLTGENQYIAEALQRMWMIEPTNAAYLREALRVAVASRHDDLVQGTLAQLNAMNPIDPRLFKARLDLALRDGDTDAAARALDNYLTAGGDDATVLQQGLNALREQGREELERRIRRRLEGEG